MNSDVNPIPGIGGFITIYVGCVIFVFVKVKDIVKEGFTIARVYEYIDKVGDQAMDIFPKFRMNKGEHAFFPTGVIPVAIGMAPKVEPQTSEVVSYVINYFLDLRVLPSLSEMVRGEALAHVQRSMSQGLEKFWAEPGNITSVKLYIDAWNSVMYAKSDDDLSWATVPATIGPGTTGPAAGPGAGPGAGLGACPGAGPRVGPGVGPGAGPGAGLGLGSCVTPCNERIRESENIR